VVVEIVLVTLGTEMYKLQKDKADELAAPWKSPSTTLSIKQRTEADTPGTGARASSGAAKAGTVTPSMNARGRRNNIMRFGERE